ncbi:MAG: hypothetical protein ONB44_12485 [candidate division KSB1 bacterium]|nr:hypothetical protein [candidate division KSB1 bacterium]MDZ7302939.1 hypothetical protein [candidate division KSB1 bacterium]MDZ7312215.1 hypothetical protein [candidate division KSB1 bacterium]
MEKKSVKISYVILLIMMIIALVYGFVGVIKPDVLVARSFQLHTEQSWTDYLAASPKLANYMLILERMAAGLGLTTSIGALFILLTVYKKAEKWAWFYVLVVGIIGWGNTLLANIRFNNPVLITVNIIGLVLVIIGLVIPAKDFLSKK